LPFSFGIIVGAGISSKLVERFAPRAVAGPGLMIAASGMYWLSTLTVNSSFAMHVGPAVFLTSFGLGIAAIAMTLTAVHRVAEQNAGIASALVNMAQQIGAALGLAGFTTISATAANKQLPDAVNALGNALKTQDEKILSVAKGALTNGYTSAWLAGAVILLIAALVVFVAINTRQTQSAAKPISNTE
jgi:predicted MFS family arabinose efflux permease